jgi:hypothetical protein
VDAPRADERDALVEEILELAIQIDRTQVG